MSGIIRFSDANPVRIVVMSFAGRNSLDKSFNLFKDYSLPNKDVYFQPVIQNDVMKVQFASSFGTNVATVKTYAGSTVATPTITEVSDFTTYKYFEFTVNTSALSGKYYLEITGSHPDTQTYSARSEPFEVRTYCNLLRFEYYNYEPAFDVDYRSGIVMYFNAIGLFNATQNSQTTSSFMDSAGVMTKINHIITRQRTLKIITLTPEWVIEKINLALAHDVCKINGQLVTAGNALDYSPLNQFYLYSEPSAIITLSSGSERLRNLHDAGERELLE